MSPASGFGLPLGDLRVAGIGTSGRRRSKDRQLSVMAVVRPEVDVKLLARAFMHVAEDIVKRKRRHVGHTAVVPPSESWLQADRPPADG